MASRGAGGGGRPTTPSEPPTPLAAASPTTDAPRAALVAVTLHVLRPGGTATGGGAPATRLAPPPAATALGAGGAASLPDAGASAAPDGAVAGGVPTTAAPYGSGVPGQRPAAAAASPTPAGGASGSGVGPPEPVGNDGLPLSAEAAASPFSPPASERHAAFLKLVDHANKAGLQSRHMRDADFSALAAEAGLPLFGDDSIIVANLRTNQAIALGNQAAVESDPAEKNALVRRAWAVLLTQALPVLQSRMDKGSLLPGKLRKVEEAYDVYEQQTIKRVMAKPVPGAATLQGPSRLMGYNSALRGARAVLALLPPHPLPSDERNLAQAFVLATLRLISKTAGVSNKAAYEPDLVDFIERHMTPARFGAGFCASVLAVWRSPAVADVLRARGSLQCAAAEMAAAKAEFDARQMADLAKRGLRRCPLPSCGKQEATVLQFRVCGHCQTTRYCCPEHAKQHWKAHKREYEVEGEGRGEAGDGGGAAA